MGPLCPLLKRRPCTMITGVVGPFPPKNCSAMRLRYHQLCSLWFHRKDIEITWQVNTARFPVPHGRNIGVGIRQHIRWPISEEVPSKKNYGRRRRGPRSVAIVYCQRDLSSAVGSAATYRRFYTPVDRAVCTRAKRTKNAIRPNL